MRIQTLKYLEGSKTSRNQPSNSLTMRIQTLEYLEGESSRRITYNAYPDAKVSGSCRVDVVRFLLGIIMGVQYFLQNLNAGYPVKDKKADRDIGIKPSTVHLIPKDATHIVWYNK